jgi:hypothetical protein
MRSSFFASFIGLDRNPGVSKACPASEYSGTNPVKAATKTERLQL